MWYVVYVNSQGRASIVSGPHKEKDDAAKFISCDGDKVLSKTDCEKRGLLS